MRVGVLYPSFDPASPGVWSGTPAGLCDGLSENGVHVVPVASRVRAPSRVAAAVVSRRSGRRGHVAHAAPAQVRARTRALSRALTSAGQLDGLIAMGTDLFELSRLTPGSTPVVTYDDGTLAQFARHADSDLSRASFPPEEVSEWITRQASACRSANACCVSSEWGASSISGDYHVERRRIHVVGMGHKPLGAVGVRDWSSPRFLFVGVDWERKNGEAVLRAFARVREKHPMASLDVVGQHPQLPLEGVRGHGLLSRDDAHAQERLFELFARSTVFVLPSKFEPFGIAYLEAASAGLPIIATSEGGASRILDKAGIIVNPLDLGALVDAMLRLCHQHRAATLGLHARRISEEYSWRSVSQRIIQVLASSG